MISATFVFEPTILYFSISNVVAILLYVLILKHRARRREQNTKKIKNAIATYFGVTGVKVAVRCINLPDSKNFTVFIESEPMKRFRMSHLVEATLRDHVRTVCDLELDRIYWRFIVKEEMAEAGDEYMMESLRSMAKSKYELTDTSIESFEEEISKSAQSH
jgi:hypothetical protein